MQENKDLIQRFFQHLVADDATVLGEYIAEDYVDHCKWKNLEGFKHAWKALRRAYTDIKLTVEDMIAEGDKIAVRFHMDCTGASNRKSLSATVIFRIANGKIVEHWGNSNSFF